MPAVVIDLWFLAVAVSYVMLELKLALDRTWSSCSGSAAHDARIKVVRVGWYLYGFVIPRQGTPEEVFRLGLFLKDGIALNAPQPPVLNKLFQERRTSPSGE